ncbi:hypothetical protein DYB32_000941 [Aphanomyces invadans]|uniref:Uncharacterized protein n=1 Tax=Aphanomyces invadans TaxID=157072 RepID=A0A3R6ZWG6_9STRA|nr:hypothetical protein DYB32_000941 [Aphanomyces invadans]
MFLNRHFEMDPPRQVPPNLRQAKSVVRRIRDELSRKAVQEHAKGKNIARRTLITGNNHNSEDAMALLYHTQLESSLRRHLKPSLLRLDACVPVEKKVIYESAKVDASLRLSQQLFMLEFAFRKFAFRWRKIKLHSGLHLWQVS